MSIRTLLRALWIGCILFGAGILPASAETRRVILLFDERSELPGLATLDADFVRSLNSAGGAGRSVPGTSSSQGAIRPMLHDLVEPRWCGGFRTQ
jgi:hypothetical protein